MLQFVCAKKRTCGWDNGAPRCVATCRTSRDCSSAARDSAGSWCDRTWTKATSARKSHRLSVAAAVAGVRSDATSMATPLRSRRLAYGGRAVRVRSRVAPRPSRAHRCVRARVAAPIDAVLPATAAARPTMPPPPTTTTVSRRWAPDRR